MNSNLLKPLPLGSTSFSELRAWDQIYVDKSRMVYELAKSRGKYFLARPRRFGKSLLISTFESLFKYGIRDFKGLAIESLWRDKTYNVVVVDFSEAKEFADIETGRRKIAQVLLNSFEPLGFSYDSTAIRDIYSQISSWLKNQPSSSIVLLIDEYDSPLTSCLNNKELFDSVRSELSSFYSVIKANDNPLRFLFLTGIAKFSKATIFSGLNNLQDISLDPRYGSLLGYTRDELEKYFNGYLNVAADALHKTHKVLMEELVDYYDGFCFEETAKQKVFAPWSVLNFLNNPAVGYKNYWFESGGQPTVLDEYLSSHPLKDPSSYEIEKADELNQLQASSNLGTLNDTVLLSQTGYLTIKRYDKEEGIVYLGYPNKEVAHSMASLYLSNMLKGKNLAEVNASGILSCLRQGKTKDFVEKLNRAFLALDYKDYPIVDESKCQSAALLVLLGSGLDVQVEKHNAHGRSDLEFSVGDVHWVIELKFAREKDSSEELLKFGVEQMKSRRYGEQSSSPNLVRLVMVFSGRDRRFVKYEVL